MQASAPKHTTLGATPGVSRATSGRARACNEAWLVAIAGCRWLPESAQRWRSGEVTVAQAGGA